MAVEDPKSPRSKRQGGSRKSNSSGAQSDAKDGGPSETASTSEVLVTSVDTRSEALTESPTTRHTSLEELAASNLVITAKARVELVQNQLIQFIEILSIKLRSEIARCKHQADALRYPSVYGPTYAAPAQAFPGNGSGGPMQGTGVGLAGSGVGGSVNVVSTFLNAGGSLSGVIGKAATTIVALGFSYGVLKHAMKLKMLAYLGMGMLGYNQVQELRRRRVLNSFENVVRAFGKWREWVMYLFDV